MITISHKENRCSYMEGPGKHTLGGNKTVIYSLQTTHITHSYKTHYRKPENLIAFNKKPEAVPTLELNVLIEKIKQDIENRKS
jgi:hypothetical protein